MNLLSTLALAAGLGLSLSAVAQWQWLDNDGKRVFSDRPPPFEVPEKNILKRPTGNRAAAGIAPAASAVTKPGDALPKLSGKDKELEENRQQAEVAEAAKKKVEQERVAKARADNCVRARQSKGSYDSGIRIARTNDKGEREIVDDATRASETQRLQQIIGAECS